MAGDAGNGNGNGSNGYGRWATIITAVAAVLAIVGWIIVTITAQWSRDVTRLESELREIRVQMMPRAEIEGRISDRDARINGVVRRLERFEDAAIKAR